MSAIQTTFARSIRELAEDEWDLVAGGELMMSHRWHRVMEASRRAYKPRYALIHDGRGPLAIATTASASPISLPGGLRDRLAGWLTLTFGAPFSASASGIAVRADTPLAAALPHIEPALNALCWRERRPLLGLTNIGTDDLHTLRQHGFVAVPRPPTMVLDLEVDAYDTYVKTLAKADRAELRRARRRADEHDASFSIAPVNPRCTDLYPLFTEVCAHHGIDARRAPITDAFFSALSREMPHDAVIISATVGGEPAGFVLCFVQRDRLFAPMVGLRYALSLPSCLYAVLIDETVRFGLSRQVRRIHLGIGNERQKRRHGFLPTQRWACLRAPIRPFTFALETVLCSS